jgi:hypothetical protein
MSNFEEPFNVMSSSVVMTLETNRDKLNAVLDLIPKVHRALHPPRAAPRHVSRRSAPTRSAPPPPWAQPSDPQAKLSLQRYSPLPPPPPPPHHVVTALLQGGGRLIVFAFSPCSAGPGSVKRVDDPRSAGTERDKNNLLRATDTFYNSLSDSFVKGMVSVDFMIATTGAFMDASCFAPLSSRTGGLCRVFNQFNLATQVLKLSASDVRRVPYRSFCRPPQHYTLFIAIHRLVCRPVGLCGVMRMRASVGISVTGYLGIALAAFIALFAHVGTGQYTAITL